MFCGLLFRPQQSVDVVVPGSALYPVGQAVQTDAALVSENVSAGHTHGPPSGPVYRAVHTQSVILVLVDDEFEFAGHKVHAAMLTVSLYVPIPQPVHGPPVGPV